MTITNMTLEETLQTEFLVVENNIGYGKIIYNEDKNESIITNGKSLIAYKDTKLVESSNISSFEKERVTQLTDNIIHNNTGISIECEVYFRKEDLSDLLRYMNEYQGKTITLLFNHKLNVLMASIDGSPSLVKILPSVQINDFKNSDAQCTVEVEQLIIISKLMYEAMSNNDILGIAMQSINKLLLVETTSVSACIACVKQ